MQKPALDIPDRDFAGYLFDFDGTLCDTMGVHYRSWEYALGQEQAGFMFEFDYYYGFAGTETRKLVPILEARFGVKLDADVLMRHKLEYYHRHIQDLQPIRPVSDFAYEVRKTRPVGIVTGGLRHIVEPSMKAAGLDDLTDVLVTFEDVAHGKPAPDMFLHAAELLGVAPEECLVFEDGQAGIDGARAAGMETVVVSPAIAGY